MSMNSSTPFTSVPDQGVKKQMSDSKGLKNIHMGVHSNMRAMRSIGKANDLMDGAFLNNDDFGVAITPRNDDE